ACVLLIIHGWMPARTGKIKAHSCPLQLVLPQYTAAFGRLMRQSFRRVSNRLLADRLPPDCQHYTVYRHYLTSNLRGCDVLVCIMCQGVAFWHAACRRAHGLCCAYNAACCS